jgi:hypothetical protein
MLLESCLLVAGVVILLGLFQVTCHLIDWLVPLQTVAAFHAAGGESAAEAGAWDAPTVADDEPYLYYDLQMIEQLIEQSCTCG